MQCSELPEGWPILNRWGLIIPVLILFKLFSGIHLCKLKGTLKPTGETILFIIPSRIGATEFCRLARSHLLAVLLTLHGVCRLYILLVCIYWRASSPLPLHSFTDSRSTKFGIQYEAITRNRNLHSCAVGMLRPSCKARLIEW